MEKQYVEYREQGYWISGSRVSLESVIITFLGREINAYLRQADADFETFQQIIHDPEFSRKMAKARQEMQLAS